MKNIALFLLILINFNFSFSQKNESELLKKYHFYVEKHIEMGKWSNRYFLKNGIVFKRESFWKNELRSRTEITYDKYNNTIREIETYNITEGEVNYVSNTKLEYKDSLLVKKVTGYGLTENYSNFNQLGKPELIERIADFEFWPFKEVFKYDNKGNIIKKVEFFHNSDDKSIIEKAITYFKYDEHNNIIKIHRVFEPKQNFPIIIIGGPNKYEYEYFRYVYNKNGLWTKKYKTVNGKEYLVAKRKYF